MMLCVNCPKKPMAFARVWGCILLLLIAVVLSFQPLITLQVGDSKTVTQMKGILTGFAGNDVETLEDIDAFLDEMPDKIDVGALDVAACVATLTDLLATMNSSDADADIATKVTSMLEDEDDRKTLMIVVGIIVGATDSMDLMGFADDVTKTLVKDTIKRELGANMDRLKEEYALQNDGYVPTDDELFSMIEEEGLKEVFSENQQIFDDLGIEVETVEEAILEAKEEVKKTEEETTEEDSSAMAELQDNVIMILIKVLVLLVCFLALLGFALTAPVVYIIATLASLIPALIHVKEPDEAAAKVCGKLTGLITVPLGMILFQCVIPTMSFAFGTTALLIVSLVCVLYNLVFSRLHSYTKPQMKYANILQSLSLVGVAGYLVFFANIVKANVFNTFMDGKLASQLLGVVTATKAGITPASNGYIFDIVMVIVAVVLVLFSTDYLKACLKRLSCSIPVGKVGKRSKDLQIVRAVLMLPIVVLPFIVSLCKNYFEDVTQGGVGDASLLVLSSESTAALIGALVGIVIVLAAEILLIVFKATFCKDVSTQDMSDVMCGIANADFAPAEKAPVAQTAPVVEAPTEEAPTEEAPTEEAPTEEAPTEEAPTEEAPTEEAPTEETPTEETPTEEAPTEEAPTEEAPTEEVPAEEAPVMEEVTDAEETKQA